MAIATYLYHRKAERDRVLRSDREKAIHLISQFTLNQNSRRSAVRKLVRNLDAKVIKEIEDGNSVDIPVEFGDLVYAAIPDVIRIKQIQTTSPTIKLTARQVFLLRWECFAYLNSVEVVCEAWRCHVVHSPTVEREMRFLLEPEMGKNILTTFGSMADKEDYPAIRSFIEFMEQKRLEEARKRHTEKPI
ncbi:MAG: hypothetical protein R3F13_13750 [Prosthecobacter sp.]